MEKMIVIDGKEYKVRFDAYFPIFYRDEMEGSDFFAAEKGVSAGDTYAALDILYAAIRYGDDTFTESKKEFLQKYDMATILDAAVEAVRFLRSTFKQNAKSKKN